MKFKEKMKKAIEDLSKATILIDNAYEALDMTQEERGQITMVRRIMMMHVQANIAAVYDSAVGARNLCEDINETIRLIEEEAADRAQEIASEY